MPYSIDQDGDLVFNQDGFVAVRIPAAGEFAICFAKRDGREDAAAALKHGHADEVLFYHRGTWRQFMEAARAAEDKEGRDMYIRLAAEMDTQKVRVSEITPPLLIAINEAVDNLGNLTRIRTAIDGAVTAA